jgi:hypothetical protein
MFFFIILRERYFSHCELVFCSSIIKIEDTIRIHLLQKIYLVFCRSVVFSGTLLPRGTRICFMFYWLTQLVGEAFGDEGEIGEEGCEVIILSLSLTRETFLHSI